MLRLLSAHGLLVFMATAMGCTSSPGAFPMRSGYQYEFASQAAVTSTILQPGATVEVKFVYTPQFDTEQVVRGDGSITLPLIGDIAVGGLELGNATKAILDAYGDKLVDPEISVIVQNNPGRVVFVGGQVTKPGAIPLPGQLTALEAVMLAGGPNFDAANVNSVVVIRFEGGKRRGFLVDIGKSLRGELAYPFHLRERDIVFVPRTRIAKLNQWIDQHINKIVPQFGLFYRKTLTDGSVLGIETPR